MIEQDHPLECLHGSGKRAEPGLAAFRRGSPQDVLRRRCAGTAQRDSALLGVLFTIEILLNSVVKLSGQTREEIVVSVRGLVDDRPQVASSGTIGMRGSRVLALPVTADHAPTCDA